jgi:site-specific DNA recombinase
VIAAIYARKSTDQTGVVEQERSVARQVEHARAYAAGKGWTVGDDHVYVDDGISGAEFKNRPGFLRLMNALKPAPRFQVLIMSEESRLGREAIETAYALKQLVTAGVRVFFFLEDRERTLDSPTDKIMMSLTAFADELEREKASQRTYDAMLHKAKAGHVTGGVLFGYANVAVAGPDGQRSHVVREIIAEQAAVIHRIFELSAAGHGLKATAKRLNDEGQPSPRAQQGRSRSWAPSSVREVLFRTSYRGEITWNRSKKRDAWGQHHETARPEAEWLHVPAPHLRIVSDELWRAAHARMDAARAIYLNGTRGHRFGRPKLGNPSPYLLTNLATCGVCGGSMWVRSRSHGRQRARFYGCAGYHERGRTACTNGADVPMAAADDVVLQALLDDVVAPDVLEDAVEEALRMLQGDTVDGRLEAVERELVSLERERERLASAIASGGQLGALVDALREREARRVILTEQRQTMAARRPQAIDAGRVRGQLSQLAGDWRQILGGAPQHARPIVAKLLHGRVQFRPVEPGQWEMTGRGTLAGLFSQQVFPVGMASHTVPSWKQIMPWLREMAELRESGVVTGKGRPVGGEAAPVVMGNQVPCGIRIGRTSA